jgi:hypothetical protein
MEFAATESLTAEKCRQRYRILALKKHPDKNRSEGAAEEFREMVEAHEFLMKGLTVPTDAVGSTDYKSLCLSFLQSIWGENREMNEIVFAILSKISKISANADLFDTVKPLLKKCVESIPTQSLKKMAEILARYHGVFHIGEAVADLLQGFVEEREAVDSASAIEIYPLLQDVWDGNVFRWTFAGKTFLVPLWHHEMLFDVPNIDQNRDRDRDQNQDQETNTQNNYSENGEKNVATGSREICIRSIPMLPSNMEIDAKNNIRVSLEFSLDEIFAIDSIEFHIGEKRLHFSRDTLQMKRQQTVRLYEQGLPRANAHNMLDISRRGDIYVFVKIK